MLEKSTNTTQRSKLFNSLKEGKVIAIQRETHAMEFHDGDDDDDDDHDDIFSETTTMANTY